MGKSLYNCLKPLCYCLDGVVKALDMLVEYSLKKRDGATASEAESLKEKIVMAFHHQHCVKA